jgi:hypothetical protein
MDENVKPIVSEDLRKWFREKWVRFGPDGEVRGDCARGSESEGKPKCLPAADAAALGKEGRSKAARRKRREDSNPNRRGKAIMVKTKIDEAFDSKEGKETLERYKTKASNVQRALPSLKREFERKIKKAEALAAQHSPGGKLPRGVGRNPSIATKAREEAAKAKKSLEVFNRWDANRTKGLERAEKRLEETTNNSIVRIHVLGQNVVVHKWDDDAGGTYREVIHHSSPKAAQTYARTLHRARGRDAELVIKGSKQINEASDLHCPECGTNHGKDRENPQDKTCNQCGHKFKNIHGFKSETDNDDEAATWMRNFMEEVKPYVSKAGKQWQVLNHDGKVVFSHTDKNDAIAHLRANYDKYRDPKHTNIGEDLESHWKARAAKFHSAGETSQAAGNYPTATKQFNVAGRIRDRLINRGMNKIRKNLDDMKKMRDGQQ